MGERNTREPSVYVTFLASSLLPVVCFGSGSRVLTHVSLVEGAHEAVCTTVLYFRHVSKKKRKRNRKRFRFRFSFSFSLACCIPRIVVKMGHENSGHDQPAPFMEMSERKRCRRVLATLSIENQCHSIKAPLTLLDCVYVPKVRRLLGVSVGALLYVIEDQIHV